MADRGMRARIFLISIIAYQVALGFVLTATVSSAFNAC